MHDYEQQGPAGGLLAFPRILLGPCQPRFDAKFAELQVLVGVKHDLRPRSQRQILAARVLEQIGAQFVDHLLLDALVARAIAGREPDRVLVGCVYARYRGRLVLVHLACQLVRELHRTDLGFEDAAERAFDKAGDHVLQCPQRIHLRGTSKRAPQLGRNKRLTHPEVHAFRYPL